MDDGGPVEMERRRYRDEDRDEVREDRKNDRMERRAERMKMREERRMSRGPGVNREEIMKRVGEKLGPMAGKINPMIQKIGAGIGGMRDQFARRPMAAPAVAPVMAPKPAMRGGGLAKKGVGMALRGGGLAKRGVGQALNKGGLVNANGAAKRGKTRGKMC